MSWRPAILLAFALTLSADTKHPILAIGSPAPDFSLPGVDGKMQQAQRLFGQPSPRDRVHV